MGANAPAAPLSFQEQAEAERLLKQLDGSLDYLAREISNGTNLRDDLFQEGGHAVCDAVRAFNPNKGATVETFAIHCAVKRMLDYLKKEKRYSARMEEGDAPVA